MKVDFSNRNVLHLTWTHGNYGGAERVICDLAQHFNTKSGKVVIATDKGLASDKFKEIDGIKMYWLPLCKRYLPLNIIQLARIIRSERIDLIHSHHRYTTFLAKWVRSFRLTSHFALLHTAHVETFGKKRFFTYGDKVIAVGTEVKRNLLHEFNVPEKDIVVIKNAIKAPSYDISLSERLARKFSKGGNTIVGFIGRLSPQKGIEYLLKACKILKEEGWDFNLVIVGKGKLKEKLRSLCMKLGISKRVNFLGFRKDIPELIAAFDFLVLPSLWEGLPLILLEGYLLGKPFVASNATGTKEVIKDQETGLLVKPKDVKGLADALRFMINHPSMRKTMGERGKNYVETNFSFGKMLRKNEVVYKKLLQSV